MSNTNPSTTSKNLGFVKAIYEGTTPPNNNMMIWADTSAMPDDVVVHKYFNHILEEWIPITYNSGGGGSGLSIDLNLGRILFVSTNGNDATAVIGDLTKRFKTVQAAITKAATISPSPTSRVTIVLFPGNYAETATLGTDYIDICSITQKPALYNPQMYNNFAPRDTIISGNFTLNSNVNNFKGIDFGTVTVGTIASSVIRDNRRRLFDNCYINILQSAASGTAVENYVNLNDCIVAQFFRVIANVKFRYITVTNCDLFEAFVSPTSPAPSGITLSDSWFENIYVRNSSSFSYSNPTGFSTNTTTFKDCYFISSNCIGTINSSNILRCEFGDNVIAAATDCTIVDSKFGSQCIKDFTECTMRNLTCKGSIGIGGSLAYVSGYLYKIDADYSTTGFANSRPFWGSMRNMTIKVSGATSITAALRIKLPMGKEPANIEHSTILMCVPTGDTVAGDEMYISYCKLNKIYANVNVFGWAGSYNILSGYICSYTSPDLCTAPTSLLVNGVVNDSGNDVSVTLTANVPTDRQGTQLSIIDPTGAEIINIAEQGSTSSTVTLNVNLPNLQVGMYIFKLRTICAFDEDDNPISMSNYSNNTTYNYQLPICELPVSISLVNIEIV